MLIFISTFVEWTDRTGQKNYLRSHTIHMHLGANRTRPTPTGAVLCVQYHDRHTVIVVRTNNVKTAREMSNIQHSKVLFPKIILSTRPQRQKIKATTLILIT